MNLLILLFSFFAFAQYNAVNPVPTNNINVVDPTQAPNQMQQAPARTPPGIIIFEPRPLMPDPTIQTQQNNELNQNQNARTYCPAGDTTCVDDRTSR